MITSIRNAALSLAAASMVASPVAANVGDSMDRFMDDMGAAANVTGPTAFEGQSAGYYSLGNVWTRFPQKTTNIANLQLPRARAGCGGIDIFAGSFSFINASEMVALMKAVANNAVGFAFSLAIDTVCPECNKIMQEFSQKAQLMNNLSINSCEMAQGLVGGLWPKGDLGRQGDLRSNREFRKASSPTTPPPNMAAERAASAPPPMKARARIMPTSIRACHATTLGMSLKRAPSSIPARPSTASLPNTP